MHYSIICERCLALSMFKYTIGSKETTLERLLSFREYRDASNTNNKTCLTAARVAYVLELWINKLLICHSNRVETVFFVILRYLNILKIFFGFAICIWHAAHGLGCIR